MPSLVLCTEDVTMLMLIKHANTIINIPNYN